MPVTSCRTNIASLKLLIHWYVKVQGWQIHAHHFMSYEYCQLQTFSNALIQNNYQLTYLKLWKSYVLIGICCYCWQHHQSYPCFFVSKWPCFPWCHWLIFLDPEILHWLVARLSANEKTRVKIISGQCTMAWAAIHTKMWGTSDLKIAASTSGRLNFLLDSNLDFYDFCQFSSRLFCTNFQSDYRFFDQIFQGFTKKFLHMHTTLKFYFLSKN